ncbi:stage IV sporulation protein FB [Bacillus pseudomycoides]|nr:stage IV sporulation protein FB [Bacillus pseudomycoides]
MSKYSEVLSKITIHPLFWGIMAIAIFTARFKELLILFFIVFIHELGHAVAAAHYKWRIKQIQLLPFGGVAELDEHGNKPLKEELIVIIAGPIQHVWMLVAAYLSYTTGWMGEDFYHFFMWNNIIILCFNLLPIWPLDGGKIALNILSYRFPFVQAHNIMMRISIACFIAVLGLQLFWNSKNVMMWTLLLFLAFSLFQEWKQRRYAFMRFLLERYYGKKREIVKVTAITVEKETSLYHIFTQFRRGYKHSIIIQADHKNQYTLDENELLYAYFTEKRTTSSVEELIG